MKLPSAIVAILATSLLVTEIFAENELGIKKKEKNSRIVRQTNADQMVQNILQWLQGVYTQQSRRSRFADQHDLFNFASGKLDDAFRQGTLREYLPPTNTQKPRPFETARPPSDGTNQNGDYNGGYPPAGSITPQPPFPISTNPVTGETYPTPTIGYPQTTFPGQGTPPRPTDYPTGTTGPQGYPTPGFPTHATDTPLPGGFTGYPGGQPTPGFSEGSTQPPVPTELPGFPTQPPPGVSTGYPAGPGFSTQPPQTATDGQASSTPSPGISIGVTEGPGVPTQPGPSTGYPGPSTGYPGPSTGYPRPSTGYPGPSTGYPGPSTGYPGPSTGYPGPSTGYPGPGIPTQPPQTVTQGPFTQPPAGGSTGYTEGPGVPSQPPSELTSIQPGFPTQPPAEIPTQPTEDREVPGISETPGLSSQQPGFSTQPPGFPTQPPGLSTQPSGFSTQPPGLPTEPSVVETESPTSGPSSNAPPSEIFTSATTPEEQPPAETATPQSPEVNTIPTEGPGKPGATEPVEADDDLNHPPHIHAIDVECAKDMMTINLEFNREFNGIIYSKGYYNMPECRYVQENSGQTKYTFTLNLNMCGTEFINAFDTEGQSYLENVLVLQNEAGIQEIWDTVRAVRCLWEGNLKESLSVALSVGMLSQELVTFSGDSAMAKLDILLGRGPLGEPANGLVKIGEPMTLVVSVSGDPGFDLQVKDCRATDSTGDNTIPLTDDNGCVLKPKLFGAFQKTRNTGDTGASIIAYAFLNAFKFPDVMDLMIECNIELCKTDCDMCTEPNQKLEPGRRRRRDIHSYNNTLHDAVTMGKHLRIILPEDLNDRTVVDLQKNDGVCMSTQSFVFSTTLMISLLTVSCLFSAYMWLKTQHLKLTKK